MGIGTGSADLQGNDFRINMKKIYRYYLQDIRETAANDDQYFVFEDTLYQVRHLFLTEFKTKSLDIDALFARQTESRKSCDAILEMGCNQRAQMPGRKKFQAPGSPFPTLPWFGFSW